MTKINLEGKRRLLSTLLLLLFFTLQLSGHTPSLREVRALFTDLLPNGLSTQKLLPWGVTVHSELGPPILNINQENALQIYLQTNTMEVVFNFLK